MSERDDLIMAAHAAAIDAGAVAYAIDNPHLRDEALASVVHALAAAGDAPAARDTAAAILNSYRHA